MHNANEIYLAIFSSVKPAPAFKVSETCKSVLSPIFWWTTPTIPPCAYLELLSPNSDFVINNIPSGKLICWDSFIAVYKPAIPLPIITAEYSECFIIFPICYYVYFKTNKDFGELIYYKDFTHIMLLNTIYIY